MSTNGPGHSAASAALLGLFALGISIPLPLLPVYALQLNSSIAIVGLQISAALLVGLLSFWTCGRLGATAARAGAPLGTALAVSGGLVAWLYPTQLALLMGEVLVGVGIGALVGARQRQIAGGQRAEAEWSRGLAGVATRSGIILGLAVGGILATSGAGQPPERQAHFLALAVITFAAGMGMWIVGNTPGRPRPPKSNSIPGDKAKGAIGSAASFVYCLLVPFTVQFTTVGLVVVFLPLALSAQQFDGVAAGLLLAVTYGLAMVLLVPVAMTAQAHGLKKTLLAGMALSAIAVGVMPIASEIRVFLIAATLMGIGVAMTNATGPSLGRGSLRHAAPTAAAADYSRAGYAGILIAPAMLGTVSQFAALSWAFYVTAILLAATLLVVAFLPAPHTE